MTGFFSPAPVVSWLAEVELVHLKATQFKYSNDFFLKENLKQCTHLQGLVLEHLNPPPLQILSCLFAINSPTCLVSLPIYFFLDDSETRSHDV